MSICSSVMMNYAVQLLIKMIHTLAHITWSTYDTFLTYSAFSCGDNLKKKAHQNRLFNRDFLACNL